MDDYSVRYLHHTDEAILIDDDGYEIWLPISQIEHQEDLDMLDRYEWITIMVPDWLAEEKEMV